MIYAYEVEFTTLEGNSYTVQVQARNEFQAKQQVESSYIVANIYHCIKL